jgi:electron transport complex protein RnfC
VCPSHIPLTANFRNAKARIQELADEKARAERARIRFESRNERLENEKLLRESELARPKEEAVKAGPTAIEEILKRKKQKQDESEDSD